MKIQVTKNKKRPIQPNGHPKPEFTLKADLNVGQILAIRHALLYGGTAVGNDVLYALDKALIAEDGTRIID